VAAEFVLILMIRRVACGKWGKEDVGEEKANTGLSEVRLRR
jgi:hypothetical protein